VDETVDRTLFFSSYFQSYLQRDVRDLSRVGDEMSFLRFVRAAAARTGQLLNISDLARDADVAPNTAKVWLSILRAERGPARGRSAILQGTGGCGGRDRHGGGDQPGTATDAIDPRGHDDAGGVFVSS